MLSHLDVAIDLSTSFYPPLYDSLRCANDYSSVKPSSPLPLIICSQTSTLINHLSLQNIGNIFKTLIVSKIDSPNYFSLFKSFNRILNQMLLLPLLLFTFVAIHLFQISNYSENTVRLFLLLLSSLKGNNFKTDIDMDST